MRPDSNPNPTWKVTALNKLSYEAVEVAKDGLDEGVLFVTYSGLIARERSAKARA